MTDRLDQLTVHQDQFARQEQFLRPFPQFEPKPTSIPDLELSPQRSFEGLHDRFVLIDQFAHFSPIISLRPSISGLMLWTDTSRDPGPRHIAGRENKE